MTTGRINQVAAFLAHPGLKAAGQPSLPRAPAVSTCPSAAEADAGASLDGEVSIYHAERPTEAWFPQ